MGVPTPMGQQSPDDHIIYRVEAGIARITFNRPEKLNAFTHKMVADLIALLDAADRDDAVRCLLISGAGRAFSAGADLSSANIFGPDTGTRGAAEVDWEDPLLRDPGGLVTLRMFDLDKPVVCAINGPAAGMGVTLTLAADIRLASTSAKFAFPFVRRGIVPESASSWFLPRIVGIGRAIEWMLSGRTFPAAEALAAGLVHGLYEDEELIAAAEHYARDIVENTAPVSVALTRHLLWKMLGADHPMDAHRIDSRALFARSASADAEEGVNSFKEKRRPDFPGRTSTDMPPFFPWWSRPTYRQ